MLFFVAVLLLPSIYGEKFTAGKVEDQTSVIKAMNYLVRFNYMQTGALVSGQQRTHKSFVDSIKRFQNFANLPITGNLDSRTIKKMDSPRCGVPDIIWSDNTRRRKKRYAFQGTRWNDINLKYTFIGLSNDISDTEGQKNEIRRAFQMWEDNSKLTFREVNDGTAQIRINFYRYYHQDGNPFDGPGGTLAHGFYPHDNISPICGDVHFDEDEVWDIRGDPSKIDLFQVAAHEIGHSIGLAHSQTWSALMAPFYAGYIANFKLPEDDKRAIQSLYGVPDVRRPKTAAPRVFPSQPPGYPDPCTAHMDAAFYNSDQYGGNQRTYGFIGAFVISMNDESVDEEGYPKLIQDVFEGLEGPIDAALMAPNGVTFFFYKKFYWKYRQFKKIGGPFDISDWKNFPVNIGAAMIWRSNGRIYLFRGSKYWRVDQNTLSIDPGYPKKIKKYWKGAPTHMDAAVQWKNGNTYFFKGDNYVKMNSWVSSVAPGYPRDVHQLWVGCGAKSTAGRTANLETPDNN